MELVNGILELTWVQNILIVMVTITPIALGVLQTVRGFRSFVPYVKSELKVIDTKYQRYKDDVVRLIDENMKLKNEIMEIKLMMQDVLKEAVKDVESL